ncbi:hypothetical protein Sa4125_25340 [Aureimonas sp. SA4125]|nr:hypothetical protein Sa4125_25340 [Aureimonas sp. SA4125]
MVWAVLALVGIPSFILWVVMPMMRRATATELENSAMVQAQRDLDEAKERRRALRAVINAGTIVPETEARKTATWIPPKTQTSVVSALVVEIPTLKGVAEAVTG